MQKRKKIELHTSIMDTMVILSEGNPGAATVIAHIIKICSITYEFYIYSLITESQSLQRGFPLSSGKKSPHFIHSVYSSDTTILYALIIFIFSPQ